jgi:hypothetical protein
MSVESDVAAVRAALLPAIARDAARRSRRRWIAPLAVAVVLAGSTGVAAATGVIWSDPQVPSDVPSVPEWQYWPSNPFGAGGGPVLMRAHPDALARVNRATEQALAAKGVTARCGADSGHPLACFAPDGELLPIVETTDTLGPADYDVKPLSEADAHAWLCDHPAQRPGADGGEKPAPSMTC